MSVSSEITRITNDRNTIRTKMIALGLGTATDTLDDLAAEVDSIVNKGAVDVEVKEGETYTVPAGYHNGSGTVKGVAGGGNYRLQAKSGVVPTKALQSITADEGYYGLSSVGVAPIPDAYQDVSSVTAGAGDVLVSKSFVPASGVLTAGTMANNGAISRTLDAENTSTTIPVGYHNGSGTVSISLEEKHSTPSKVGETVTPTAGKVLSKVTVDPIGDEFIDTSSATISADEVLSGEVAYGYNGTTNKAIEVVGTMPNNGAQGGTLDVTTTSKTIPAGYTSGGTVSITLEEKSATPTTSTQNVTPTSGKVLSKVTVNAIPTKYKDTTGTDAVAGNLLSGKKAVVGTGMITGSMPNNGAISGTITGLGAVTGDTSFTVPAGYTSGGTVSLTSDIENALLAI